MSIVLKEWWKMLQTALGREKMFGYKTQLANRFYLTYLLGGKFYTEYRWIHPVTRYTMITYALAGITSATGIFVSWVIYADKKDFQCLLFISYSSVIVPLQFIAQPYFSAVVYSDDFQETIQLADDILVERIKKKKLEKELDIEYYASLIIYTNLIIGSLFFFYMPFAMLLFYEEEKTHDYNYYLAYVPNLEGWGSKQYFYFCNLYLGMVGFPIYMFSIAMMILAEITAGICHNEALHIAHDLDSLSCQQISSIDEYKAKIEPHIPAAIQRCVHDYQRLMIVLEKFRGYYTTVCGLLIPGMFLIELSHIINIILPGSSMIIRIKEICAFIITATPLFTFCWAGDILKEVAPIVWTAVYNLPWYWSTKHRQDIYVLLCQAQVPTDQTSIGVYAIELRTFLRLLNVLQSFINLLRAVAF